ncbi:MAG: VWA domain-containing protein [Enhygromyxa sp.]
MFVARHRSPCFVVSLTLSLAVLAGVSACKSVSSGSRGWAAHEDRAASKSAARHAYPASEAAPEAAPEPLQLATDAPEPLKVACNEQDPTLLYLSPDDSNSMSSPAQIRDRVLNGGGYIQNIAIRPWEFMNYYSWDYPAADPGELALTTALAAVPGSDPEHPRWALQIAVTSEAMSPSERPPMNVTLVLDTSGSMGGKSIELLKTTSETIAASLRTGDTVSIVEWDTRNTWSLANHRVSGPHDQVLLRAIARLEANGGTDLHGGLSSGYELANKTWNPQAINRLVLISDGGANVGITDIDLIGENATRGGEDGIYLVGVGVGDAHSYHDQLMDEVTDAGKGASLFIGSERDAEQMFGARFLETMGIAARDVRVELTLPPGFDLISFSGEEYSTVAEEIEPQHLAPNDTMVFFQELETCAPQLVSDEAKIDVRVTWRDRDSHEARELARSYTFGELFEGPVKGADLQMAKGAAVFAYARGLQKLNRGYASPLVEARAAVDRARLRMPNDADLAEIDRILAALGG